MDHWEEDELRAEVRTRYAAVAANGGQSGCGCSSGCCTPQLTLQGEASLRVGYSPADLAAVPAGAEMGLGCGNPQALAALKDGEIVLDLGCGGGFDCFLAARQVGSTGRVIGVDMTPEMIQRARANARAGQYANVEFRLGEIEHLPVADNSVDVILSNCVINLAPDKQQVYVEAYRVLKKGGRLAIADVVALQPLPPELQADIEKYAGCVAGAATAGDIEDMLRAAGFRAIRVRLKPESREAIREWFPGSGIEDYVRSGTIEAQK